MLRLQLIKKTKRFIKKLNKKNKKIKLLYSFKKLNKKNKRTRLLYSLKKLNYKNKRTRLLYSLKKKKLQAKLYIKKKIHKQY